MFLHYYIIGIIMIRFLSILFRWVSCQGSLLKCRICSSVLELWLEPARLRLISSAHVKGQWAVYSAQQFWSHIHSAVDNGGAGGARVPLKFGGSEKGQSLISTYRSLTITTNTPGFKALSMALIDYISRQMIEPPLQIKILRPSDLNYRIFYM